LEITIHPPTKKFLKDLPAVEGMSERHLLVLVSTCIMVATRTMGRIMRSMALVYGQLIRLGVLFLGRSDGLKGTWEENDGGNGFSVGLFNDRSSDAVLLSLSS
jgi:hypothetical protein